MAACRSLPNIFEKPLPEIPRLRQSLAHLKHRNALEDSSFFLPSSSASSSSTSSFASSPTSTSSWTSSSFSSSPFSLDFTPSLSNKTVKDEDKNESKHHRHGDSISSLNSCQEGGVGFENSKVNEVRNNDRSCRKAKKCITRRKSNEVESLSNSKRSKRSQITGKEFPPPISSIGRSGKPWLSLKSYKQNGRFILKEVRIPIQEFLHATREDGRLKLQIVQSDEEDYSDENDQRCDHCCNWDEQYDDRKNIRDDIEGDCL